MDKQKSFENAIKSAKTAGFNSAVQKMKAVDFAAEFRERGIDITSGFEQQ